MSFTESKRREIKNYILRKIDEDDSLLISKTADSFGISATSVKRYLDSEREEGHIKNSADKACGFELVYRKERFEFDIRSISEREDFILYDSIIPTLKVGDNAKRIWRYVLPEIFNNALEHSEGTIVKAYVDACFPYSRVTMVDDGIGIFTKIRNAMTKYGYKDPLIEEAVTELYKGKFTSCPERHTGEGIFFSMRMLDRFAIASDGMLLRHGFSDEPAIVKSHLLAYAMKLTRKGTVVMMQLDNETRREAKAVFRDYSDIEQGFIRTKIPVYEACLDHDPVARSQARRIAARLDSFQEAVLDFENVDIMGQGFADELFRVYHNEHPEVKLTPVNMNEFVNMVYHHAVNTKVTRPVYE